MTFRPLGLQIVGTTSGVSKVDRTPRSMLCRLRPPRSSAARERQPTRATSSLTRPADLVRPPTLPSNGAGRWIRIDTEAELPVLARTRLIAAKFPYYYLADSCPQMTPADEDIKNYLRQSASSADKNSSSSAEGFPSPPDIRKGFVYKRVPHVTLKSIANNPDIKEGMTRPRSTPPFAATPRMRHFTINPMKIRTASG